MEEALLLIAVGHTTSASSPQSLFLAQIIILERCSSDWEADWIKSYCYNINHHGLKWFRGLGLEEVLAEAGVPNATKVVTVSHKVRKGCPPPGTCRLLPVLRSASLDLPQ